MPVNELLIYRYHRLYYKPQICFLQVQVLRHLHQLQDLVEGVGPPSREIVFQEEGVNEGILRVEVLRGQNALGAFDEDVHEDLVERLSLLKGFKLISFFMC
jgi:hypothetical protein